MAMPPPQIPLGPLARQNSQSEDLRVPAMVRAQSQEEERAEYGFVRAARLLMGLFVKRAADHH